MENKVKLALVASGSGTDANSIMAACRSGKISNAEPVILISTKDGAGCLEKAANYGVRTRVLEKKETWKMNFDSELMRTLEECEVELVFLVGCVVVLNTNYYRNRMPIYNIHPADPQEHGGKGMYGLAVHEHVLLDFKDLIDRGMFQIDQRFFTFPTVHEVDYEPDTGQPLLQISVEIPPEIINDFMSSKQSLHDSASRLQQHVLPYEWLILPAAVEIAAKKILDERSGK